MNSVIYVFGTRGFPNIQGGVECHCERLYPQIKDLQFVVFRRLPYVDSGYKGLYPNISFMDLPSTKIMGFEAVLHSLLCTIVCIVKGAKIVHIHNIGPAFFSPILRLFGIQVVLTYHSPNYEHQKWGFFGRNLLLLSEKLAFACCNKIIFVNSKQREKFSLKLQKKSFYIPNGVVFNKVPENPVLLSKHGLSRQGYVICVGRLVPEKGFDDLIRAYDFHGLGLKLLIVGDVDHQTAYDKKLKEEGEMKGVIFFGKANQEELSELYGYARLFVISSHNEGFPLVLLEAMSYSLPIVASDIPANKQVDLPKKCYYSVGNVEELRSKIDLALRSSDRSVKYDLSAYDWTMIARQTKDVFDSLR